MKLPRAAKQEVNYTQSGSEDSSDISDSTCYSPSQEEISDDDDEDHSDDQCLEKKRKISMDINLSRNAKQNIESTKPSGPQNRNLQKMINEDQCVGKKRKIPVDVNRDKNAKQNIESKKSSGSQNSNLQKKSSSGPFNFDENCRKNLLKESNDTPEEEINVTIARAKKTADGKRVYDKVHACLYCGVTYSKVSDHMMNRHKEEDKVKQILDCKDQKQKDKMLDYLRFRGDYHHNCKTLISGGELIVWRRPVEGVFVDYRDYVPCQYCLAFVTKAEMWRHVKTCSFKDDKKESSVRQSELMLFSSRCSSEASDELRWFVLDKLKKDDVGQIILKDSLICMYG